MGGWIALRAPGNHLPILCSGTWPAAIPLVVHPRVLNTLNPIFSPMALSYFATSPFQLRTLMPPWACARPSMIPIPYGLLSVPGHAANVQLVARAEIKSAPSSIASSSRAAFSLTHDDMYKTELCRNWQRAGACSYKSKCSYGICFLFGFCLIAGVHSAWRKGIAPAATGRHLQDPTLF